MTWQIEHCTIYQSLLFATIEPVLDRLTLTRATADNGLSAVFYCYWAGCLLVA